MIRVQNLSKRYLTYGRTSDRLWDWFTPGPPKRGKYFWALRDLTLDVPRGSSLGVVGVNGAGKSTLLKILTGVTSPTEGSFLIEGRVSALLELGAGFHPEFTGRENILFNGKMLGLSEDELRRRTPEIIEFSELADFIDQPIRTYSSGMALRLAFAVASAVEPDTLIVDEALSVGDLHFQQKCLTRIRQFHDRGVTVLFVSHDPGVIKRFCNEAILLDAGRLIDRGRPDDVLDHYNALLAEKHRADGSRARIVRPRSSQAATDENAALPTTNGAPPDATDTEPTADAAAPAPEVERAAPELNLNLGDGHRTGNFQGMITSVRFRADEAAGDGRLVVTGRRGTITVRAVALEPIASPTLGFLIKDRLGAEIYGTNTGVRGIDLGDLAAGEAVELSVRAPMNLGPGVYTLTVALHSGPTHTEVCYDWVERAEVFQVLPSPIDSFIGVARLDVAIETRRERAAPAEVEAIRVWRGEGIEVSPIVPA